MVNETAVGSRPRLAPLLVLGVGVGLEIVYISLFSPFVTTDGAAHAGAAAALVDTVRGFELDGRFLEWNPWPAPNLLGNLLLAALLPVFGVEWALRLILAGYVVALPVATLYAVRAMRPGSAWLACFALPVTFSFCVLWGFFSFAYSIIAFLLTAGFLLRSPLRLARTRTAALAGLLLLTFFAISSHLAWPVSSSCSCSRCVPCFMASSAGTLRVTGWRRSRRPSPWRWHMWRRRARRRERRGATPRSESLPKR